MILASRSSALNRLETARQSPLVGSYPIQPSQASSLMTGIHLSCLLRVRLVVARSTQRPPVAHYKSQLREGVCVLYVVRHGRRCSPSISCALLAQITCPPQNLLPPDLVPVRMVQVHVLLPFLIASPRPSTAPGPWPCDAPRRTGRKSGTHKWKGDPRLRRSPYIIISLKYRPVSI